MHAAETTFAITHARLVRTEPDRMRVHVLDDASVLVRDGRIEAIHHQGSFPGIEKIDARGRLLTPGLVDCHTHANFLGDRAAEFAARASGTSYLDLATQGGGIRATLAPTRAGTQFERLSRLRTRLARLAQQGVTTVEVKSGYGLTADTELELLRDLQVVASTKLPAVSPTLLAAHTIPPEVTDADARTRWVDTICDRLIPEAARLGLARAVDVYVEQTAYTPDEARRIAAAAKTQGLALHLHVDQLTDGEGAALAAGLNAAAAAHLERSNPEGIRTLARSGTVAVLLPTATVAAREPGFAPARALVDAGVPIALATNLNPGTAPTESFALTFFLAATGLQLRPEEILWAATRGGAKALGLAEAGLVDVGGPADLCLWNTDTLAHLPYHAGVNHLRTAWRAGVVIADRPHAELECDGRL